MNPVSQPNMIKERATKSHTQTVVAQAHASAAKFTCAPRPHNWISLTESGRSRLLLIPSAPPPHLQAVKELQQELAVIRGRLGIPSSQQPGPGGAAAGGGAPWSGGGSRGGDDSRSQGRGFMPRGMAASAELHEIDGIQKYLGIYAGRGSTSYCICVCLSVGLSVCLSACLSVRLPVRS